MNPAASQSRAIAPVAFEDGLGERLYAVGAANEPLEVLKVSNELTCVSSFEDALRQQAAQMADFRHEAFGRVRAVERLDARSSTIVVISDHVRGVRLSDVLAGARKRSIPLEYKAAAWLIRQLVSAIAALHDSGPGVVHGSIAPERLVITPDGRLVVVEYVLGPALEEMHFSWERYWRELGIALPRPIGLSRFDQTADVTQLAAVALALLLGRPLEADEYPNKIADVLDSATARLVNGSDPLPAALRTWLRRALHIEPRAAFTSALDAQAELDRVLDVQDVAGRLSLRSFLSRYAAAIALERQLASQPKTAPVTAAKVAPPVESAVVPAVAPAPVPAVVPDPEPVAVLTPEPVAIVAPEPVVMPAPVAMVSEGVPQDEKLAVEAIETPLFGARPAVDVAAVDDAAIEDGDGDGNIAEAEADEEAAIDQPAFERAASVTPFLPRTSTFGGAAAEKAAPEVRVPVPESGPWATLGPAPVAVAMDEPEMPRLEPEAFEPPPAPVPPAVGDVVRAKSGRPVWQSPWAAAAVLALISVTMGVTLLRPKTPVTAPEAALTNTGTLEIGTNPDGVAVMIDGTNRGATPLTVTLSPGAHDVELVSGTDRRKVPLTMKAGAHMSHFIEMPKTAAGLGELLVRTDPSKATVTVDGRAVGRTPVTVKGLSAGTHRVVLENESGSFTDDVIVEAGATASLVVPMTKQPVTAGANVSGWIAVNAPADLQLYEGGRLVGSSKSDRIMVAVGRHDLEMVNEALGYRSSKTVDVAAGQVAVLKPDWPKGSIAVNALPWAEVSVDGERLGETPIGSISVPIGTHEIVFRHPELGERRTSATVTTGAATRVSMDMRAK